MGRYKINIYRWCLVAGSIGETWFLRDFLSNNGRVCKRLIVGRIHEARGSIYIYSCKSPATYGNADANSIVSTYDGEPSGTVGRLRHFLEAAG